MCVKSFFFFFMKFTNIDEIKNKLHQTINSFREVVKNKTEWYGEIMFDWYSNNRDTYFLICKQTKYNVIYSYIFLDKRLFKEEMFNFIKDCQYGNCVLNDFPSLRKQMIDKLDMKDELFKDILSDMYITHNTNGDCIFIYTDIYGYIEPQTCIYNELYKVLLEKYITLSDNIVKFFSNPAYYKDGLQNQILELNKEYNSKKDKIEQITKDLKLLEKYV